LKLIRRFFLAPAAARRDSGVLLGIGDDAALLELPKGTDLVASVDTIVAGGISCKAPTRGRSGTAAGGQLERHWPPWAQRRPGRLWR